MSNPSVLLLTQSALPAEQARALSKTAQRLSQSLAEHAAAEGRRFAAEARDLIALKTTAETLDPAMGWASWAAEAAMLQGVSEATIRSRATRAARLMALPALLTGLEHARIGVGHALAVLDTLTDAPAPIAAHAAQEALDWAGSALVSPGQLAAHARRVWYRLDAEAVARQRREAVRRRRVWFDHRGQPGVSLFGGAGTTELALAAEQRLATAARTPVDDTDTRTVDQRRADLALELMATGQLPDQQLPGAPVQLSVHIPVETLHGTSDEPALLTGAGLIDALHARQLAATGQLVAVATDPVTAMPIARHEGRPGTDPAPVTPRTREQLSAALARLTAAAYRAATQAGTTPTPPRVEPDGTGTTAAAPAGPNAAAPMTTPIVEAGVAGLATTETHYRPSARLERFIRTRFTTSIGPGSISWRTDVEHRIPWPTGPTAGWHLTLLSRRWHRLKQTGFTYTTHPDGTATWTSPTGTTVTTPPPWSPPTLRDHDPPPPAPPETSGPRDRGAAENPPDSVSQPPAEPPCAHEDPPPF